MSGTIWDRVDFQDVAVDFAYGELLPEFSEQRLLAIEITRHIPRSWWTSYGSLAKAYNWVVKRERLGYAEQNPKFIGRMLDDLSLRQSHKIRDWTVPWHRLRDQNGYCRSPRIVDQVVRDNADRGNVRWHDEGGRLTGSSGQAVPSQRIDIDLAISKGLTAIGLAPATVSSEGIVTSSLGPADALRLEQARLTDPGLGDRVAAKRAQRRAERGW